MKNEVKKTAYVIIFMALALVLAPFTSIPAGIAKINPTQHFINVFLAVLAGTWRSVGAAAGVSLIRNALGVGTLLAFPGSMIGACLSGLAYRMTRKTWMAAAGEVMGTGFIAPVAGSLIIAPGFMGRELGILTFLPGFLLSSAAGSFLALVLLKALEKARVFPSESVVPS